MSRFLGRAATAAACIAIVLLVVLLVILWTGVRSGSISSGIKHHEINNENVTPQGHLYNEPESRNQAPEIGTGTSMIFDRLPHRFDVKTGTRFEAENATGEVGLQSTNEIEGQSLPIRKFEKNFSPGKENVEHISPKKIHQNIYEDPADGSTAARHDTGHFRHSTAEVWDPHPQYEFKAFGKDFHLLLSQDTSFVSPNIKVTHVGENSSRLEHLGHQLGCFYTGTVKGDPRSVVSVSLCHGMRGHIRTSTGNYMIEPADRQIYGESSAEKPILHMIYLASATRSNSNSVNLPDDRSRENDCVLIDTIGDDEAPALLTDDTSGSKIYVGEHHRDRRSVTRKTSIDYSMEDSSEFEDLRRDNLREFVRNNERRQFLRRHERPNNRYYPNERRNYPIQKYHEPQVPDPFETWRPRRAIPQEYFIEVMVVADAKMSEYHGKGLSNYILVLMSTVSRIYKDPSIGNAISIAVVKIWPLSETFGDKYPGSAGIAANDMLRKFCFWQKRHNHADQGSPEHHDAALLLTRENLCHNTAEKRCDTLGLAELGRVCVPRSSCAIVQDNGLAAAFTIAHEIGHVLSMPHDDDLKCQEFGGNKIHNVMSRMLDDKTFPWEWSNCSRHFVTEFLDFGFGNCLLDEPSTKMTHTSTERLPGEDYSENKQCELVFGLGSKICPYMAVCRRLWCTAPVWDKEQQCHTQHMPWADGTACAHGKWCQRGDCVSRKDLKPVDGQWGQWGEYGECSRTCGGGIRKKHRLCNNPQPQNGGNYCVGTRVKFRSCATKDCPSGGQDFREEQCSRFNNNSMNIPNLGRNVQWHAKYTRIQPGERCKLYCQVKNSQYYKLMSDKVIDGTPCSLDTFDICVNGLCKAAGCDHVLNSTAELDTCGVCRGDNSSCQRITGTYNISMYGYNRVTKIPAGSSYIDIKQHGWRGSNNDSNYLALRNSEKGNYILNGRYMVSHHKMIIEPGITMEYSGPESVVERLNSSRPIAVDLILEILSVENMLPPQISYEYTVPKNILTNYTWVLSDWSGCNRVCHGTKYRIAECRGMVYKDVVSDGYCRAEEKPREESQTCNTHCTVRWGIISRSECSSHCGPGTRTVVSQCTYHHMASSQAISEHACKHLDRPAEREACTGPCDDAHWLYGEWGSCSATCKGGIQTRTATCVDSDGQPVSETKCNAHDKLLKKICEPVVACPKWAVGEWTPCSVTCGIGKRERLYGCQIENRVVDVRYCNSPPPPSVEVCEMVSCPSWEFGDWSSCSVTCGEGMARRDVTCRNANGVSSSHCNAADMPPSTRTCMHQPCLAQAIPSTPITYTSDQNEIFKSRDNEIDTNKISPETITFQPAYKWRTGNFAECSKPCNGGERKRMVRCSSAETGELVRDDYCIHNQKPLADLPCNQHACPSWNTGDWSQCDSQCGSGFKHRQVQCRTERGETVPDKECSDSEKPRHVERCFKAACMGKEIPPRKPPSPGGQRPYRWRISKWTPCSKSCGNGTKTRRVDCIANSSTGDVTAVNERECLRLERRPKSQRPCQRIPCDLTWQEGTWSECSEKCGNGIQRRTVSCHRVNRFGWTTPSPANGCKISERPSTEQTCKLRECNDEYYWVPGQWRECNAPCGRKGKQQRALFCHRRDGKRVARRFCPPKFKPQRKRKCNQRRCAPVSCLQAKKRYKTTKDDEYSLLIGGKFISIYCHNMTGDHPSEYLTLPTGDRENFAEMYDKRLLHPNTCPFNGQRNDGCNCVTESGSSSGHTMFQKIRLDPKTLVVTVDDYTFSRTQGSKRVEFGKAGDCYSSAQCPQGRFSINLTGTQLRISPDVSWVSQGSMTSRVINKINQQRVVGKCGGYCGFCKLETGLKLDVLPP